MYTIKKREGYITVFFSGDLIGDDRMPDINKIKKTDRLILNFRKLNVINSSGIRNWILWTKKIPKGIDVVYSMCPSFLIDQVNMVTSILLPGARIRSFYVPYFCENCNNSINKFISIRNEKKDGKIVIKSEVPCGNCPSVAEIDVIEAKFFSFINDLEIVNE